MGEFELIEVAEKHDKELAIIDNKEQENHLEFIRSLLVECSDNLKDISKTMSSIQSQGGWQSFWNKAHNIRQISEYVNKVTTVQRRTLDLVVLLMGGLGKVKQEFDFVMESIEELRQKYQDDVEVLEYLVKMKRVINELKVKEELLNQIHINMRTLKAEFDTSFERLNMMQREVEQIRAKVDETIDNIENLYAEVTKYSRKNKSIFVIGTISVINLIAYIGLLIFQ
jgi:chromosome segregation ATPase